FGFMNNASFMSPDGTQCTLYTPPAVEALTYMQSVYDDAGGYEAVQSFQAGFQTDALDPFILGKVAMKIDGNESMRQIAQYARDLDFGIAPPPRPAALAKDGPVTWSGGWALAVPSNSRNKQAAWDFIRFCSSDTAYHVQLESGRQTAEAEGRTYLPSMYPRPSVNKYALEKYVNANPDVPVKFQTAMQTYDRLLPAARFRPVTPVGQLLWNEQIRAMETALYHRMSPSEALQQSQAIVQRGLDSILKPAPGTPIHSWSGFYVAYAAILLTFAVIVAVRFFGRRTKIDGLRRKQWAGGLICVSPWLIGFIIFGGGPMLFSLIISFCDYDILNPPRFIGLANYREMILTDNLLPTAVWNTVYMVIGVPLGMGVSLGLAMLLNQKARGIAAWRTLFYLPAVVPMVVSSVLWIWILNPEGGLINLILEAFHIQGPRWLQSAQWSKPSLILMGLWTAGSGMIVWLAGLNGIPESLYEAASIDGAGKWRQFWNITLPQLTPYIFFNMLMGLIGTFQIFGQAFVMTGGGPENSTLFYVYHLFNYAFRYGRMGYASAMAWGLFIVVLGLTALQLKLSQKWVHYGDQA
ncbi:MAG: sugar transport system permease protein, partial [Phycisphaerales bacterium]|nr:sugar transport system permease protein [Phycisphaerales bacterium]